MTQKTTIATRFAAVCAFGISLSGLACGSKTDGAASSATPQSSSPAKEAGSSKAASSAKPGGSAAADSSAQPAGSASASTAGDLPAVTREAFCERAVKLGEASLAKCSKEDQSAVSYLDLKNAQQTASADCTARLSSKAAEFHGDVAAKCLAACEKKAAFATFQTLEQLPECVGVLSGTVAEGQPAKNAEECASGLSLANGKCQKSAAENADCGTAGSKLGKPDDHAACVAGLRCSSMGSESDGNTPKWRCIKARAIGEACPPNLDTCVDGAWCYQGKCRARAEVGGECMQNSDCVDPEACHIEGCAFGKCIAPKAAGEECGSHEECLSRTCRGKKCLSICGSG